HAPLKSCGRCQIPRYCSRDCQRQDWKVAHKAVCPALTRLLGSILGVRVLDLSAQTLDDAFNDMSDADQMELTSWLDL
ncbi:hypothetical protein BKA62DRAFT_629675, partial [Auriculariales sp. MPI-PUGE-AT-0066]